MEFIKLMMLPTKDNGKKGKRKEKGKLSSKVEAYSREISKTISSMAMGKCTITHRATIFKENGGMI